MKVPLSVKLKSGNLKAVLASQFLKLILYSNPFLKFSFVCSNFTFALLVLLVRNYCSWHWLEWRCCNYMQRSVNTCANACKGTIKVLGNHPPKHKSCCWRKKKVRLRRVYKHDETSVLRSHRSLSTTSLVNISRSKFSRYSHTIFCRLIFQNQNSQKINHTILCKLL